LRLVGGDEAIAISWQGGELEELCKAAHHLQKFAVHVDRGIPFDQTISNFDGNWLHQNDWSYNCIAPAFV
jgi:hypothetical protein